MNPNKITHGFSRILLRRYLLRKVFVLDLNLKLTVSSVLQYSFFSSADDEESSSIQDAADGARSIGEITKNMVSLSFRSMCDIIRCFPISLISYIPFPSD